MSALIERAAWRRPVTSVLIAVAALLCAPAAATALVPDGAEPDAERDADSATTDDARPVRHSATSDDARRLRLFALIGYGPQDDSDAGSYGVALGLKASYAAWGFLHVGVDGTFHVGSQFGDELNRVDYAGLEVGYRASSQRIGFTPYLTLGLASVSSQRNLDPSYVTPHYGAGFAVDVITYDWLLLGLDVRLFILNSVRQGDNSGTVLQPDVFFTAGARL